MKYPNLEGDQRHPVPTQSSLNAEGYEFFVAIKCKTCVFHLACENSLNILDMILIKTVP